MTDRGRTESRERSPSRRVDASGDEPRFSYAVGMLDRSIRRTLTAVLRPFGVTVPEYTVLSLIRRRDGYSNAQLARRSLVSPQAMNEVIRSLEDRDLVLREPSPAHKAIRHTYLTEEGRRLLDDCDAAVDGMEAVMLEGIPQGERTRAIAMLLRCADELRTSFPTDA